MPALLLEKLPWSLRSRQKARSMPLRDHQICAISLANGRVLLHGSRHPFRLGTLFFRWELLAPVTRTKARTVATEGGTFFRAA
jgi:hypothetical protein